MRILRTIGVVIGIAAAVAGVIALAAAFWLHLAANARPEPDVRAPLARRTARPMPRPPNSQPRFRVRETGDRHHIVDSEGRVVILRGVTLGAPGDPAPHLPLGDVPRHALSRLRDIGVNTVRVPVSWDSLETDNGGIDGQRVRKLIDILVAARGLDMNVVLAGSHEGVPGGLGAGGLPDRSLRGGPLELEPGPFGAGYDTLRQLPHRIRWWADFRDARWTWDDRALQDHLIDSWVHLAALLHTPPALVGVSPIRRPECFPGWFGVLFDPASGPCCPAIADFQGRFFTALRTADADAIAVLEPPVSGIPWRPGTTGIDWSPPEIPNAASTWSPPKDPKDMDRPPAEMLAEAASQAASDGRAFVFLDDGEPEPSSRVFPATSSPGAWIEALDAANASGFFRLADIENPPEDLVRALNRPCPLRIAGIPVAWTFGKGEFSLQFLEGDATGATRVRVPPTAFVGGATWDDLDVLISDGRWSREARDENVIAWQTDASTEQHVLVVRLKTRKVH